MNYSDESSLEAKPEFESELWFSSIFRDISIVTHFSKTREENTKIVWLFVCSGRHSQSVLSLVSRSRVVWAMSSSRKANEKLFYDKSIQEKYDFNQSFVHWLWK